MKLSVGIQFSKLPLISKMQWCEIHSLVLELYTVRDSLLHYTNDGNSTIIDECLRSTTIKN